MPFHSFDSFPTNHDFALSLFQSFHSKRASNFQTKHSKGWQNSIRHNLSLNECFVKVNFFTIGSFVDDEDLDNHEYLYFNLFRSQVRGELRGRGTTGA